LFEDGSRFIFRLSGTGSSGATVRLYLEKYINPATGGDISMPTEHALSDLVDIALSMSRIHEFTGMSGPTVIT
jgi:phosphoglucomutase